MGRTARTNIAPRARPTQERARQTLELILDTAESLEEIGTREIKKVPTLRGKTVVNFFVEPSTRTRSSFELAEKRLSADALNFSASTSSFSGAAPGMVWGRMPNNGLKSCSSSW